ncbi:MAG: acyl carrier protein [Phycisphaerales bacterium]
MTKSTELADPYVLVATALGHPQQEITLDSAMYRDHGWDSFGHLNVIMAMESAYGIVIEDTDVEKYKSMKAIVEFYERIRGEGRGKR